MPELLVDMGLDGGSAETFDMLIDRLSDMTPVMEEAARILNRSVLANFEAGGRPVAWLADREPRPGGRTLVETGRLITSFTAYSGPDRAGLATEVPYAAALQNGTDRMPARPFMLIQDEDAAAITDMLACYLTGGGGWPY